MFCFAGEGAVPGVGGVVVVGAGVGDAVFGDVGGGVEICVDVVEAEFEDAHAEEVELVAELGDVVGDYAEVFDDAGEGGKFLLEGFEEFGAGGGDPFSVGGVGGVVGDFPGGGEAAEVVDADDVAETEGGAEAGGPPVVVVAVHGFPVVDGVAPVLAGGAEVVGRGAGVGAEAEEAVEFEEVGFTPDVGGIVGDEDGEVAEDLDVVGARVFAEGGELAEEEELGEAFALDLFVVGFVGGGEGFGVAVGEGVGPVLPVGSGEIAAEGGEEGVVVEPVGFLFDEVREGFVELGGAGGLEAGEGGGEGGAFELEGGVVVEFAFGEFFVGEIGFLEEAVAVEVVEADEEGVAGVGGVCGIGAGVGDGWVDGEGLPPADFGVGEAVDDVAGLGAEVAGAMRGGEGGEVEEEAGGAVAERGVGGECVGCEGWRVHGGNLRGGVGVCHRVLWGVQWRRAWSSVRRRVFWSGVPIVMRILSEMRGRFHQRTRMLRALSCS